MSHADATSSLARLLSGRGSGWFSRCSVLNSPSLSLKTRIEVISLYCLRNVMLSLLILIFMDWCLWEGSLKNNILSALSYTSMHGLNCPNGIIQHSTEPITFESLLLGSTTDQPLSFFLKGAQPVGLSQIMSGICP